MPLPVKPFRQGDLDGLCGFYAIINAVRVLCPEVDRHGAAALFQLLLSVLLEDEPDPAALLRGIEVDVMWELVEIARCFLRDELKIRISARPLRFRQPRPSLAMLWSRLQVRLDKGSVAIIGLSGRHEHWTLGYRMTAKAIRLIDSDDLRTLLRSRCGISRRAPHLLSPQEIIILTRLEVRW